MKTRISWETLKDNLIRFFLKRSNNINEEVRNYQVPFIFFILSIVATGTSSQEPPEIPRVFQDCTECPRMVVIEPGEFYLTSPPLWQGRPFGLGPMRKVIVEHAFAIGQYEITVQEWDACVTAKACEEINSNGTPQQKTPIHNITWHQASAYTKWLTLKTKHKYRLPSEAEWEYAARAGSGRSRFFDLEEFEICDFANVYDLTAHRALEYEWPHISCEDKFIRESPVGSFKANKFKLYDMLGNVWEWTEDCKSAIGTRHMGNSSGPVLKGDCTLRAFRGSSWLSHPPKYIRPPDRYKYAGAKDIDLGFRVVRELEKAIKQ